MTPRAIQGRGAFPGVAVGLALTADCTLAGWDTFDTATGQVKERGHPLFGISVKDRVLIVRGARGSTGWGTQFLKLRVAGVGPVAMVFPELDSRTAAASVVMKVPVVTDVDDSVFQLATTGSLVRVDGNTGTILVLEPPR